MPEDRLDQYGAEKRLEKLPNLEIALGEKWIAIEYKKPVEQWSLITGWISSRDEDYWPWLKDLDNVIGYLGSRIESQIMKKVVRKIKLHSDRANFKATLSELALMMFLANKEISIDIETLLGSEGKNVDICVLISNNEPIYIEVQWLSPSDASEQGAAIASLYDEAYPMDYDLEEYRIKKKIFDKTPKFTRKDITFVALDCTSSPELGGRFIGSPIGSAAYEAFTGRNLQGEETSFASSNIDTNIRFLVDSVVWFQLSPGHYLIPVERGICINPSSPHASGQEISKFRKIWIGEEN